MFAGLVLCSSCAYEYNKVYKYGSVQYKYEYAKECFAMGKYSKAITLLEDLVSYNKGKANAEECLYMLGMAQFNYEDYESASLTFGKYATSYTRGKYAEQAFFYKGESLYLNTPEPRLDQSDTYSAVKAFQDYIDIYPSGEMKEKAQDRLFVLQDKLVKKELHSAQLYYDLGTYFGNCTSGGNNYDACIVTAQNALKEFPYSSFREDFSLLVMKSKYKLAGMSVDARLLERYQDALDECYGFLNEYPDSKNVETANNYIKHCKKVLAGMPEE